MERAESKIEVGVKEDLKKWCRENGIWHEFLKLNVLGFRGWPDRLLLWEGGNCLFIEYKTLTGAPEPLQPYIHKVIKKLGFRVEVHNDRTKSLESIKAKILATARTDPWYEANRAEQRIPTISAARERKDCDCLEGIFRVEEDGAHRCTSCHRTVTSDRNILALPTGTMGRFRTSFIRDYTWREDGALGGDGHGG